MQIQGAGSAQGEKVSGHPFVTVVIPCYLQAQYLSESTGSVCAQEYPHWEAIIVNDGSPDGTSDAARSLIKSNPSRRIRLVEKENGGVSDARNAGLREASGDLLMSLDADDMIEPGYLSRGIESLAAGKGNIFYSSQHNIGAEPGEWDPAGYSEYAIRYANCITNAALYSRDLFFRSGGYKRGIGFAEDWEYWISCSRLGLSPCRSEERLYIYRVCEGGLASTFIHGRYKDCISIISVVNDDLYPVEEVLMAHDHVPQMSDAGKRRLASLDSIHRDEWFLKFCLGLLAQASGARAEALRLFWQAVGLSGERNWQPFFKLAELSEAAGQQQEAVKFFRKVHTLRPDMSRFVLPRIVKS